jgi:prepilin-type N-terminal cleavage/methylation domain-containing protein
MTRLPRRSQTGVTLIELMIVLVVIGVMVGLAVPVTAQWASNQRLTRASRAIEGAFSLARSEAIRTGNIHLVFVGTDADGTALSNPVVVLDDGRPGSTGQNCAIDSGEHTTAFSLETGVSLGSSVATARAPNDTGAGDFPATATFVDADGNDASWVLFRPEGYPLAVSSDCDTGAPGSGGGGVYLTNGERDVAVILTPLGATELHTSNPSGGWSQ